MREKARRIRAWAAVALCSLAIFLTVPAARAIQAFVAERAGEDFFIGFVLAVIGAGFAILAFVLAFRMKIRNPGQYAWIAACAALYAAFTLGRRSSPIEAIHFLEYGLLGFFLFRAWRLSLQGRLVYAAVFFAGTLVGTADEILQWIVPRRYWDIRDVGFNALAVGLFVAALWLGVRPRLGPGRAGGRAARTVSWLIAANIVLLGLCLSNTPERTAAMAARIPFLAFLEREEPMHEFKIRHRDPEIGVFFSRLTADWLKKTDLAAARPNGRILKDWRDKDYSRFLGIYNPLWAPFLHEMRVHLFRRDKYDAEGTAATDENVRREARFIAYKENRILEKYFGRTLGESGYTWPEEKHLALAEAVDASREYESPVSKGLLPRLDETTIWLSAAAILALLVAANVLLRRKRSPTTRMPRSRLFLT
jgi:VanZ family protein